jgi:hypothetical protein
MTTLLPFRRATNAVKNNSPENSAAGGLEDRYRRITRCPFVISRQWHCGYTPARLLHVSQNDNFELDGYCVAGPLTSTVTDQIEDIGLLRDDAWGAAAYRRTPSAVRAFTGRARLVAYWRWRGQNHCILQDLAVWR